MTKTEFLERIELDEKPNHGDLFSIDIFVNILDELDKESQANDNIKLIYYDKMISNISVYIEKQIIILNEEEISFSTLSEWFNIELQVLLVL